MIREIIGEGTVLEIKGNKENIDILNRALGEVDLTHQEERSLIWLSTVEKSTIENIISAFLKVK